MLNFKEYRKNGMDNGIIENKGECHLPCVVLLDTSGSMAVSQEQLLEGLKELGEAIKRDDKAIGIVEFCIITFDTTAKIVMPFCPAYDYVAPKIFCHGSTAMHSAVDCALNEIESRKKQYKENNVLYYRPWIFMLTDGYSNDVDNGSFERLKRAQMDGKCIFFSTAIGDADVELLKTLSHNGVVLKADRDNFQQAFSWLSNSISKVSNSRPEDKVSLANPIEYQIDIIV